jgi:hypothetical protein
MNSGSCSPVCPTCVTSQPCGTFNQTSMIIIVALVLTIIFCISVTIFRATSESQ